MKPAPGQCAKRRGAALILVVVVIAVAVVLAAGAVRRVVSDQRDLRLREMHAQAVRLAESGVARALARWRSDAQYDGETWTLSRDELHQSYGAEVNITFQPAPDSASRTRITATAVCGSGDGRAARHTETLTFPTPTEEPT